MESEVMFTICSTKMGFSVAQMVRKLPETQETQVQSLSQKDLEKEMATHSSILTWRIRWTEEPGGGLQSKDNFFILLRLYNPHCLLLRTVVF